MKNVDLSEVKTVYTMIYFSLLFSGLNNLYSPERLLYIQVIHLKLLERTLPEADSLSTTNKNRSILLFRMLK